MKKLKHFFYALILTSLAANVALAEDDLPAEGQIAPDFTLTQFDGSEFKLSNYRGKKPVYLVFWNTWCTFCMKKIPKLKEAQANLSNEIAIIAVNTTLKDTMAKSLAFQKRFEINYPLAFDEGKIVTDLYGVWGTPTEFIINTDGVVVHRDGVPDDLRAHLASWSQPTSNAIANKSSNCNSEKQTC